MFIACLGFYVFKIRETPHSCGQGRESTANMLESTLCGEMNTVIVGFYIAFLNTFLPFFALARYIR